MLDQSINSSLKWCVRGTIGLCYSVIFIACLVLFGWLLNNTFLKSISSSFEEMHISTAILMILSSIALLLQHKENGRPLIRQLAVGCAVIVCFWSILSIWLLISNNDKNILMPFVTSINLFLLSIALIFIDNKFFNNKKIFSIIIMIILLSALFSLLGYLFIEDKAHLIVTLTRMSIYTSIEFFILSIALLLARPHRGVIHLLLENSIDAYILRRVPFIVFLTIIISAYIANLGEYLNFYDDGFSDLLTAIFSIVILIIVLTITSKELRKQEIRGDKNESLFLGFSENVNDVFWETTPEMDKVLYVSPAFDKIWEQSREVLINNPSVWFNSILPKDQLEVRKQLERLKKNDLLINLEYQITLPDGTERYIYDRRFQQKDKQGKLVSLLGISTDISHLHATSQRILAQHEISKMMESGEVLKEISPKILQIICLKCDWDVGEILLLNKEEDQLKCFSIWHRENFNSELHDFLSHMTFSYGSGIPGKVWKENKSLWKIDAFQPLKMMVNLDDLSLRTIVAVPILYKQILIGVMTFSSKKIKQLDEHLLNILEVFGLQLGEYITHRKSEEKMTQILDQDHLTGLMTREHIEKKLQNKIDQRSSGFFPVIMLDLDKFKLINESLDYEMGDTILKTVAEKLEKFSDRKLISRMSGNTFALIPECLENLNQITNYVYKILSEIKKDFNSETKSIFVTASIGVSIFPQDGKDAKELLKNANFALVKAKREGGDNFQFYTNELTKGTSDQFTIINELRNAIAQNQLLLYFQPKISTKTGKIQGVESLIRWQHSTRGILTPNIFMPIAEENNLIIPMTEWIIFEACNIINKYKLKIPIAINLSGEHFKENFNLIGYLNQILKGFHINPSSIELEITEKVFMSESKQNLNVLVDLKKMGFKIAIDDFGTGFSSLSYLKNIAADYIKIDKSFIDNIPDDVESVIITKAIMDLAHSLNKNVIAEGVETLRQLQFLVNQDCDQIQGYYFSQPLPIEELMTLMNKTWDIPSKS
jgi:diguanylate cyclase (GGDEF)-like protein